MKEGYEPKNLDQHFDCVVEECAEVIQAICKIRRFGLTSWHPDDPERISNKTRLRCEIIDLESRLSGLKNSLRLE